MEFHAADRTLLRVIRLIFMTKKNKTGFSMIGVIVALFITSIALVSILGLVTAALKSSETSEMKLIALGLAQEGIEVVRDMRKANLDWDDWYTAAASGDYRLQHDSASLIAFSETPLNIDSNGLYQYDTGSSTPFYRKITLSKLSADEVRILVEVKWQIKSAWNYLKIEDHLWNWR